MQKEQRWMDANPFMVLKTLGGRTKLEHIPDSRCKQGYNYQTWILKV